MQGNALRLRRISDLSHIFWTVIFILFSFSALAQQGGLTSVTTKNGMTVKGELVNLMQGEFVELKTPLGTNLRIGWEDIATLDFLPAAQQVVKPSRTNYPYNDSTYYLSLSGGYPFGLDSWGYPSVGFSVSATVGKSFGPKVNVGVCLGYDFYWHPNTGIVPLGLELRGRTKDIGFTPFYFLQTGYGFVGYSEYESSWRSGQATGGFFASPGIGIMSKKRPHSTWFLQFGVKMQTTKAEYWDRIWDFNTPRDVFVEEKVAFRRIDLKFGYIFD